jgi:hypothetical protein
MTGVNKISYKYWYWQGIQCKDGNGESGSECGKILGLEL